MLITLWELIGIRHSSPPSSIIWWVCEDFWKQRPPGKCLSVCPPSSACPALSRPRDTIWFGNLEVTFISIPLVPEALL